MVKIKKLTIAAACCLVLSCKPNMPAFVDEYNKMFVPSEDILWTVENIENSTQDFEHFKLEESYTVSKDTGLFIIGGPRDCKQYIWTVKCKEPPEKLYGPYGNQILELRIKTTDLITGAVNDEASLKAADYTLRLQCTSNDGVTKFWETTLKITP